MCDKAKDALLVVVCGLPAAGKTTLVKELVTRCNTVSRLYQRISFDDLYEQETMDNNGHCTKFDPTRWRKSQQEMVLRVSKQLRDNTYAINSGSTLQLVLLVDDNFQYRSLRKRFFHLAIEMNCGFGVLYVKTPIATCRERNANRGKKDNHGAQVPDEVFERMVTVFEAPDGSQNSWELNTCEIKATEDISTIEKIMNALILQASHELNERRLVHFDAQKKASQQCRDRISTQQNVLHLVDLQLRRWISSQVQDENSLPLGKSKSELAFQLNHRRKSYLMSMKQSDGNIVDHLQEASIDEVVVSYVRRFQHQE